MRTRISRVPSPTVRMVLVATLTPLLWVCPDGGGGGPVAQSVSPGVGGRARHRRRDPGDRSHRPQAVIGQGVDRDDDPELFAIVDRLCALADLPRPDLVLSDQRQPNSWVVHLPHQTPRLYLTAGLRELLTLEELGAVLGHELTHIINRDALVMSVVGLPGSIMRGARGGGVDGMLVLAMGLLSQLGTVVLSRYRELAADAGPARSRAGPPHSPQRCSKCRPHWTRSPPRTSARPSRSTRSTSSPWHPGAAGVPTAGC